MESEIRRFLQAFAASHGTTIQGLSRTLEYKSKTSLLRLMDDNVRPLTLEDFHERMKRQFNLTAEEEKALNRAIHIKQYGEESYTIQERFFSLTSPQGLVLSGAGLMVEPCVFFPDNISSEHAVPLEDLYRDRTDITVSIFNSSHADLARTIHAFLRLGDATVNHYIHLYHPDLDFLITLSTVLPVIFYERYHVYVQHEEKREDMAYRMFAPHSNTVMVSSTQRDGIVTEDIFFLGDMNRLVWVSHSPTSQAVPRILSTQKQSYHPLKRSFDQPVSDYVLFLRACADLEKRRNYWLLRPDIHYASMEPHLMYDAIVDTPMISMEKVGPKLLSLMEARHEAFQQGPYHKFLIHKYSAFERFMQTGKTMDHPWMMRPFTMKERREIIQHLLEIIRQSSTVHFFFLRDESICSDMEIGDYDRLGLLLTPPHTDYSLHDGYNEVLIESENLSTLFQSFYSVQLLRHYCMSASQSRALLEKLL